MASGHKAHVYLLHHPRRARLIAGRLALSVVLFGPLIALLLAADDDPFVPWMLGFTVVMALVTPWWLVLDSRLDAPVRVNSYGVWLGHTRRRRGDMPLPVRWADIRQVVLLTDGVTGTAWPAYAAVGVRLRPHARPLARVAEAARGRRHPDDIPPGLRVPLGGATLDRDRLVAAVGYFGPPDVQVVDEPLAAAAPDQLP